MLLYIIEEEERRRGGGEGGRRTEDGETQMYKNVIFISRFYKTIVCVWCAVYYI